MPVTQTPDRLSPKKRVTEGANRGSIADLFDTSPWAAGKFWLGTHYFIPRVTVPPLGCGPAPRLCHIVGAKSLVEPSHTLTIQVQSIGMQANARLRKLVADLTPDKEMLSEVIKKKLQPPHGAG